MLTINLNVLNYVNNLQHVASLLFAGLATLTVLTITAPTTAAQNGFYSDHYAEIGLQSGSSATFFTWDGPGNNDRCDTIPVNESCSTAVYSYIAPKCSSYVGWGVWITNAQGSTIAFLHAGQVPAGWRGLPGAIDLDGQAGSLSAGEVYVVSNGSVSKTLNWAPCGIALAISGVKAEATKDGYVLAIPQGKPDGKILFTLEKRLSGEIWGYVSDTVTEGASATLRDESQTNGRNTYRVTAMDAGGSLRYSNSVEIYKEPESQMTVWPNPCTGDRLKVRVKSTPELEGYRQLTLFSPNGLKVESVRTPTNNLTTMNVYVGHLPAGVYVAEVQEPNGEKHVRKVLID